MTIQDYRQKRFAKNMALTTQQVIDELMLVPTDHNKRHQVYVMNAVAGHVWGLLDGQRRVEDIVGSIVAEFEVSPEKAEADLVIFLQQLEQVGVAWVV
jgi:hypothetical protein